jgi:hypothetical protein
MVTRGVILALFVCVFITWVFVILIFIIPKTLSGMDMVILFFVNTVLVVSTFTILSMNLEYLLVSNVLEKVVGVMIYRMFAIPLVLIISANVFRYAVARLVRCVILCLVWFFLIFMDHVFSKLGMIQFVQWNLVDSSVVFACFLVFSSCMAWLIVQIGKKEATRV